MSVSSILLNDAFPVQPAGIYYCKETELYDYPFFLRFEHPIRERLDSTEQNTITHREFHFYFHSRDYTSSEAMLQTRTYSIMNQLFLFAMDYFEQLQDLCVEDETPSEFMQTVILDTVSLIYPVLQLVHTFHTTYKGKSDAFTESFRSFLHDFQECFCLLEDYFQDTERIKLNLFRYLVDELVKTSNRKDTNITV